MKNRTFDTFVIVFVILTGAGFGWFTGRVYSDSYWWVGVIVGVASGYPLAKLYLKKLKISSTNKCSDKAIWLRGTFVAIICGLICTTLAHGIMTFLDIYDSSGPMMRQLNGFWFMILMIGELIGACAGFIVGGICSLLYLSVRASNETV